MISLFLTWDERKFSNGLLSSYLSRASTAIINASCFISSAVDLPRTRSAKLTIILPPSIISDKLIESFREKYKCPDLNLIGRYPGDKYYDGQIWVICSLALAQIYIELYKNRNMMKYDSPMHRSKSNPNNNYIEIANEILERILTLEPNLILPEQFNPTSNEMLSANKLTWNYSELYKLYKMLN